ncbi:ribonuclease [Clostridium tepidiprofundi DSM 19306]|uniref:Ribonuclease n=1 Tax=Clostridium tepidiprofundi DSM 19306 TaxID=1121338 RepID=A0A151ASH5_9CLOT|nr:MBL fold metallo-hydrolase RNA specificity domain-containing protein [Clostridium tepidiprofundi]KYH30565.1 ribonuclease [Clostridium tepidiprofundi DSM 19306]
MKISFLGGAYEVGASCILVNIDGKNILMDSGIRQSMSKDPMPDFRTIQENGGVDAIVISHAHLDHIGTLPIISKEYPNARIYMNNMTKDLVRVLLYDSLKIMNNREAEIPLYADIDVENMLNRIFTINYQVEFEIFDDIRLTFYNAGHIAGASCIYLKGKECAVFYSGDFSVFSQKSIEGAKIPRLRPDIGIFEATYGDKLHSNREIEEERLIDIVNRCISENGHMLIPAFALGRAQEVILILKKAMNTKKIKKVNIYVDGMIKDINRMYKRNPLYLKNVIGKKILRGIEPFYDDNIKPIQNKEQRESIFKSKESCIVISSSGMLTGGPSQYYAEKLASKDNGYIVITGYQDEEAPGRKLLNLLKKSPEDRTLEINNKIIPVKCKIERVGLSAHADKGEIKAVISRLMPKNIFLVHGDSNIISEFSNELNKEIQRRIYTPKSGESFDINIKNPRKQFKKNINAVMDNNEIITSENINLLWMFVRENYNERLFTVEELMYIWYGKYYKELCSEDIIKDLQELIIATPYFDNDIRRLFLFKACSREDVEEALKPSELKQNEVNELAIEYFKEYNFKKIGLILGEKKIVLNFDFPKAVSDSIKNKIHELEEHTKWKVEINEQTNKNAAEILIRQFLENTSIKKISFFPVENEFVVQLNETYSNGKHICDEFKKITGINLKILDVNNNNNNIIKGEFIINTSNAQVIEQNKAFSIIDEEFKYEEFRPYKKSIKTNGNGKFIELAFISPVIGNRYKEKVKELAMKTGWNFVIGKSANQNEIINFAIRLCNRKNILLKKNPSFNASSLQVILKISEEIDDKLFEDIKNEFEHNTGCVLIIK